MPVHYGYTNTIFGTQSTINGSVHNYNSSPADGATWAYSGPDTYFVVNENDGAVLFNSDESNNEFVDSNERIGQAWQQTVTIGGSERQIIFDYSFQVTDGTNTWTVSVIDVDLNNDNDLQDAGEDGYYLIFPDGMPPADTDLTVVTGSYSNTSDPAHLSLGAGVVCFAAGTLIDTARGPRAIETLCKGDMILTRDDGMQPLRWIGRSVAAAQGDLAPIVIKAGTFDNQADLVVSPQHAILFSGAQAELLFGSDEVLIRAVDLLAHDGVYRKPGGMVTYYHLLFDTHQLVRSEGQWSESLYPGDMAMQNVAPAARREIARLFPDLEGYGAKARPCLRWYEAKLITQAHDCL